MITGGQERKGHDLLSGRFRNFELTKIIFWINQCIEIIRLIDDTSIIDLLFYQFGMVDQFLYEVMQPFSSLLNE